MEKISIWLTAVHSEDNQTNGLWLMCTTRPLGYALFWHLQNKGILEDEDTREEHAGDDDWGT